MAKRRHTPKQVINKLREVEGVGQMRKSVTASDGFCCFWDGLS